MFTLYSEGQGSSCTIKETRGARFGKWSWHGFLTSRFSLSAAVILIVGHVC